MNIAEYSVFLAVVDFRHGGAKPAYCGPFDAVGSERSECRQMADRALYLKARATFLRVAQPYDEGAEIAERREACRKRGQA